MDKDLKLYCLGKKTHIWKKIVFPPSIKSKAWIGDSSVILNFVITIRKLCKLTWKKTTLNKLRCKIGKVRRVANAASKFRGQSLNNNLLTGLDLLNSLLGVLMRFRENQISVLADIEGMFMQIAISQTDYSALRFLWINDDEIQQYQFKRLIFGATCNPSFAIYVLNHCVDKNGDKRPEAVSAVKSHLYMDDYIQSGDPVTNATRKVQQTIQSLQEGGFRLTKIVSNESDVLKNIPTHDIEENSEITWVLGQKWNLKSDTIIMKPLTYFSTNPIEYSQRKIFSLVCSIFDSLGILSPLTIRFKILLQEIWKLGKKWDEQLPIQISRRLQKILDSYFEMPEIHLTRTLTSLRYSESSAELHIFLDASTAAMAAVAYLRKTHNHSEVTETCFLIGNCKVAPIKQTSVPKFELEAAVIGVRLHSTIVKESSFAIDKTLFWTDSQVVLDWIASSERQLVYIETDSEKLQHQPKENNGDIFPHWAIQPTMALVA